MKTLLFATLIFLASCSKSKDALSDRPSQLPSVASIKFSPTYAGANMSIKFNVKFNIPNLSSVSQINMIRIPYMVVSEISKPSKYEYIMYDHMVDTWPTYPQYKFYQIEFKMTDGTSILGDKFQVY